MKKNKIIVLPNSSETLKKIEKLGITNFLFPVENFSIGYNTFTLKEIEDYKVDAYLLINRILTDDDIDAFLKLKLPNNVKGLFIEDTGLFYALKGSNLELINFQNHLNNNPKTINFWLNYFDSLVLSTDITLEEIKTILDETTKPLVTFTFGYPMVMYSRRHLVSNYLKHQGEPIKDNIEISLPSDKFFLKENDYGTGVFTTKLLDARSEYDSLEEQNIKFYLFNGAFIDDGTLIKALNNEELNNIDKGFLYKSTIYRIGDLK